MGERGVKNETVKPDLVLFIPKHKHKWGKFGSWTGNKKNGYSRQRICVKHCGTVNIHFQSETPKVKRKESK